MLIRLLTLLVAVCCASAAEARWREASTKHFVIYSEQSERDLRRFAQDLERFDRTLRVQLRRPDEEVAPATRLTIYVLPNLEALQRLYGGPGVAGFYTPRQGGSLAFTFSRRERAVTPEEEARQMNPWHVLFHEYTHHFLNNNFAFGAPFWFSEGYPEFWSTVEFDDEGNVRYGIPAFHRNVELTEARPVHVRELLTLRQPIRSAETQAVAYGRGGLLTHYLQFAPERRGQLDAYLAALARGQTAEQALSVFGDLERLNGELNRYLRSPRFNIAILPAAQVPPATVAIREVSAGEEAVMSVRIRSKRGVNRQQGLALLPEARRAAAPYPNDAIAQVTLAEAEYDVGNFAEAEAAADRAIAANPRLVDAHLYRARAMWGRIQASGNATPAQWQEVQARIGAANRADPDDPEPLALFYESFHAAGMRPTPNAVEGLLFAHQLAPESRELRLAAGRELLAAGRAPQARATLAPFSGDSHSGELGPLVAEVLDILERGEARAALTKLDEGLARLREAENSGGQRGGNRPGGNRPPANPPAGNPRGGNPPAGNPPAGGNPPPSGN